MIDRSALFFVYDEGTLLGIRLFTYFYFQFLQLIDLSIPIAHIYGLILPLLFLFVP